uniref:snRNA-activating protein complex subunit 4 n=1 Tax=Trichuris muris TaxID=70415 RepID=A0A5S6QCL1_TRIMR
MSVVGKFRSSNERTGKMGSRVSSRDQGDRRSGQLTCRPVRRRLVASRTSVNGAPEVAAASSSRTADTIMQPNTLNINDDLKELITWLRSSELVPSVPVVLSLLEALKMLSMTMIRCVKEEMRNLEKRIRLNSQLWCLVPGKYPEDKFLHMLYLNPYFRDDRRFIPMPNRDTVTRKKLGLANMLVTPLTKWSDEEVSLLSKGVKEALRTAMLEKISEECSRKMGLLKVLEKKEPRNMIIKNYIALVKQSLDRAKGDLEQVESYGKKFDEAFNDPSFPYAIEWDQVADVIRSGQSKRYPNERSEVECRSAWLYTFAPWINRDSWSNEELCKLLCIAKEKKEKDWDAIALELGTGRTAFACLQKYVHESRGKNAKGWSKEEDESLLELVPAYSIGDHVMWRTVAFQLDGRNATQCRQRYEALRVRRGHWTEEEDKLLLKAVKELGKTSWVAVAAQVRDRSAVQCRARYMDVLARPIRLTAWTEIEDEILMLGFKAFGRFWTKISNLLVGRTGNQVKMRFRALEKIRRKLYSNSYEQQLMAKDRAGKVKVQRRLALRHEMLGELPQEESGEVPSLSSLESFLSTLKGPTRHAIEVGLTQIIDKYNSRQANGDNSPRIGNSRAKVEKPNRKRRRS